MAKNKTAPPSLAGPLPALWNPPASVELFQNSKTAYSQSELLRKLFTDVCLYGGYQPHCGWPEPPQRAPIFDHLRPLRVIKKRQLGKPKSVRGYVWVDVDPIAILLNKTVIRSCHSIDNVNHSYRAGNFNHVYNPFCATLFAGAVSPHTLITARGASSGNAYYNDDGTVGDRKFIYNGEALQCRSHQAVANVFFMRNSQGLPYLVLGRLYDSCPEKPWAATVLRYMKVRAMRLGVGLAVGSTWANYNDHIDKDGNIVSISIINNHQSMSFSSPLYDLPFRYENRRFVLTKYFDDDMICRVLKSHAEGLSYPEEAMFNNLIAYSVVAPDLDAMEKSGNSEMYSFGNSAIVNSSASSANASSIHPSTTSNNCYTDGITACGCCGLRKSINDFVDVTRVTSNEPVRVCNQCRARLYKDCNNCGVVRHIDKMSQHPFIHDYLYCRSCYCRKVMRCTCCSGTFLLSDYRASDYASVHSDSFFNISDGERIRLCPTCFPRITNRCVTCCHDFVGESYAINQNNVVMINGVYTAFECNMCHSLDTDPEDQSPQGNPVIGLPLPAHSSDPFHVDFLGNFSPQTLGRFRIATGTTRIMDTAMADYVNMRVSPAATEEGLGEDGLGDNDAQDYDAEDYDADDNDMIDFFEDDPQSYTSNDYQE